MTNIGLVLLCGCLTAFTLGICFVCLFETLEIVIFLFTTKCFRCFILLLLKVCWPSVAF